MSSVNALMRLARREVWRAKGRSTLIVLMIFAPILIMTVIDVTTRSLTLSDTEGIRQKTGAAEMRVQSVGMAITQDVHGGYRPAEENIATAVEPNVSSLLSNAIFLSDAHTSVRVRTPDGIAISDFRMLDYSNPLATGLLTQKTGHAPRIDNEIALSTHAVKRLHKNIGDVLEVTVNGENRKTFTVVGTVEDPSNLRNNTIIARPNVLQPPSGVSFEQYYLANPKRPLTWNDVKTFNAKGVVVLSNTLIANPPPESTRNINGTTKGFSGDTYATLVLLAGLATMEICLLAGTAFAVGVRRQRRSLALLAATGGTKQQLHNVVLSMAIILGVTASGAGVVSGIAGVAIGRPWLEQLNGARFSRFQIDTRDIAIIVVTGLAAALLSAIVPARAAAHMDVTAALNGRRDPRELKRRWKMHAVGCALVVIGIVVAFIGAHERNLQIVLAAAVAGEVGLVLLTSPIIGIIGRAAAVLPFGPRFALRDAVRNRTRTAPVVAAIMAAVAGSFVVSTYAQTTELTEREQYNSELPKGYVTVPLDATDSRQIENTQSVFTANLPIKAIGTLTEVRPGSCMASDPCYGSLVVQRTEENRCPSDNATNERRHDTQVVLQDIHDDRCMYNGYLYGSGSYIAVGDEGMMHVLFGDKGEDAASALRAGKAIVTNRFDVAHDITQLLEQTHDDKGAVKTTSAASNHFRAR